MADIQESVVELQETTQNIKAEILDIKEVLADQNGKIVDINKTISQTKTDFNNSLKSNLNLYVSKESLDDTCYNKSEIDTKFEELECINITDVENYLTENSYVTSQMLSNYINMSALETYTGTLLQDYYTKDDIKKLYYDKSEIDSKIGTISIDLSPYVQKSLLQKDYYTKSDVDELIPSTSGFVRKTELTKLIPIDDYALQEYVDNTFIKKGDISLNGYVTKEMLSENLDNYKDVVKSNVLETKLNNYVKKTELSTDLNNLQKVIKDEYIPTYVNNEGYLKEKDIVGKYATKEDLRNILNGDSSDIDMSILEGYVKEESLDLKLQNYITFDNLKNEKNNILTETSNNVNELFENFKSDYLTISNIEKTYVTKEELRNFINNIETSEPADLKDYVKKTELSNYVDKTSFNDDISKLEKNIKSKIVPQLLESFKSENNYVSKTYVDTTFAKKTDVVSNLELINDKISNLNFDNYVKKSDMDNYISKSDISNYIDNKTFVNFSTATSSNISKINDALKNCVKTSNIKEYVRLDSFELTLEDYVTKSKFEETIKQLTGTTSGSTDISELPTFKDINKLSAKINSSLNNYILRNEVYTRDYINNNYLDNSELKETYVSKTDGDTKYLKINDAANEYLTITDARAKYLLKEDYRGIKDAMTLSSTYKHSSELFGQLVNESKIQNGFYVVDGKIVIVKDNVRYDTQLLNPDDSYCSQNYVDETFVKKNDLRNVNWKIDMGGKY